MTREETPQNLIIKKYFDRLIRCVKTMDITRQIRLLVLRESFLQHEHRPYTWARMSNSYQMILPTHYSIGCCHCRIPDRLMIIESLIMKAPTCLFQTIHGHLQTTPSEKFLITTLYIYTYGLLVLSNS
uniref:Uncharacterized protein n=1 Tax=Cacopsylla melanoneura TaxID=428564 RepID=A0A8D8Z0J6_9HEMI